MKKQKRLFAPKNLLTKSVLVVGCVTSATTFAASVCTDSNDRLVFKDANITANGTVYVGGYQNSQWFWSDNLTCSPGECTSIYSYSGGQIEFRVEGPGVTDYYSPGPSNQDFHAAQTPASCDAGSGSSSGGSSSGGSTSGGSTSGGSTSGGSSSGGSSSGGSSSGGSSSGGSSSGGSSSSGGATTVEAESGSTYSGARTYSDGAASGGSGVAYISSVGAGFSVTNVPASSQMVITYASMQSGSISIKVNGADVGNVSFSSTGNWTVNYSTATFSGTIPENATIDVFHDNGDAALNVDKLEFNGEGSSSSSGSSSSGDGSSSGGTSSSGGSSGGSTSGGGSSSGSTSSGGSGSKPAIPANGQRYYFIGQDQKSIQDYHEVAGLPQPYGYTVYATLSRGEPSYDGSYCFKGLDGLKNLNNYNSNTAAGCAQGDTTRRNQWGSGVQNVEWVIATYNPEVINLGLWCPRNDSMPSLYNNGAYDDLLTELADFFKANSSTKFLMRTCYEFNGDAGGWSDVNFRNTFKYIRNFMDNENVQNVAHVWQSDAFHGTGRGTSAIGNAEQGYWPGKQYVDWIGVSQFDSDIGEEAGIAQSEGLPLFIAEATPHGALFHQYDFKLAFNSTGSSPDGQVTLHNDLDWFNNKDNEIYQDVVKGWAYINADWSSQPQWANAADQAGQNYFKYSDTRVQMNSTVQNHFTNMVSPSNGFILGQ